MKEKIIGTTYAPLEEPYQIIVDSKCYNVGMQIGTLIVTTQTEEDEQQNGYSIHTHSHPVVARQNKKRLLYAGGHYGRNYREGDVWDKEEVDQCRSLCLTDHPKLSWAEFIKFLSNQFRSEYSKGVIASAHVPFYWRLRDLGVTVGKPAEGNYTLHLQLTEPFGRGGSLVVCTDENDLLPLNFPFSSKNNMLSDSGMLVGQLENYIMILRAGLNPLGTLHVEYVADDDRLQSLVNSLNSNIEYTNLWILEDNIE